MAKEFGSDRYQNDGTYTNTARETDNLAQGANPSPRELHDYSAQQEAVPKAAAKNQRVLFRSLTTAAVATVAAVTILPGVLTPSLKVSFDYLDATDSTIEYMVSFENWEEDDDIRVLVVTPNGSTVSEQEVEGDYAEGTVEGLKEGARYSLVVKEGDRTVGSRWVTMAFRKITSFVSIEHECRCAVDGMFHFQCEIIDENGYWSHFTATLTDAFGNSSSCDFSSTPTAEHTLAVNDAGMRGNEATLRITCLTTEDGEEKERVLYESAVSI